jgi:hypothetical protein
MTGCLSVPSSVWVNCVVKSAAEWFFFYPGLPAGNKKVGLKYFACNHSWLEMSGIILALEIPKITRSHSSLLAR